RTAARALAPLTAAGTAAAASVAGPVPTRSRPQRVSSPQPPIGGVIHSAGPIQSLIGSLIPVPLPVPDWSKPIILALVLICALLGARAWVISRRARRLESQRRRLADDLESLQPALVPEIPPSFGPLAVSVAYRPADGPAAGGDFYDVFPVGGSRVAMMVGDVSGHGRHALTRAAHMRYMLRAYLETGLDPRSALKLAGRVLGADDDALFTTVAVAVYDRASSTMTYATAGHPPPIMLGPGAHEPLSVASPAMGWGEPTGRRQTTVPFGEYARACFFSDGVTEVRVPDGLLGRPRLMRELDQSESASELLEHVQRRATSIRDDMAACVVEARAGTPVSDVRVEEFEVEQRHLDAGHGQRFLNECGVSVENANSTLAHARLIVADSGSALLRVEMADGIAAASAGGSAPVSLGAASVAASPARPWVAESPSIA
ncbi:MAG TPA: PP2C family protein-serine/threonine phosphatase, partial [Solirubrobacteraceae bacterium]